jgi:hypothetical protein
MIKKVKFYNGSVQEIELNKGEMLVEIFSSGRYGKSGYLLATPNQIVRFNNGKVCSKRTLAKGYNIIKVFNEAYGWGIKTARIKEENF